jgi:hypothetical protein
MSYVITVRRECDECEGSGVKTDLAPCTTFDYNCACNGPHITVPCTDCLLAPITTVVTLRDAHRHIAEVSPLPEATAIWVFGPGDGYLQLEDGTVILVEYVPDVTVRL